MTQPHPALTLQELAELDWRLGVVGGNAHLLADMVAASSVALVADFTEPPAGAHALRFDAAGVEASFLVPDADVDDERSVLAREIQLQAAVIDSQLDSLDPEGASFLVKSRTWYRRKKKRADAIDPAATLQCGDRILKRLAMMKRLRQLGTPEIEAE